MWGIASALGINALTRRRVIGADAAIGVVTTSSFALGLALFAVFGSSGRSFDAALFASILGVSTTDVLTAARHIYERAGFRLRSSEAMRNFGQDVVSEHWDLAL